MPDRDPIRAEGPLLRDATRTTIGPMRPTATMRGFRIGGIRASRRTRRPAAMLVLAGLLAALGGCSGVAGTPTSVTGGPLAGVRVTVHEAPG